MKGYKQAIRHTPTVNTSDAAEAKLARLIRRSKTNCRGAFPGQKIDILKCSEQTAVLQCTCTKSCTRTCILQVTRITRIILVLPLFYPNYAQHLILL